MSLQPCFSSAVPPFWRAHRCGGPNTCAISSVGPRASLVTNGQGGSAGLTGTKKFLLLLPLVFFCAVRPAHAQTKYYIGGCIAETASSASVNCSPSPGIPIGSSVAVYVTFTARMPSMRENTRILVAFCIGALLGMAIVFSVV